MINELYDFDEDMVWECSEHGEYTEYELERAGIDSGCPFCFAVDEEDSRTESEGC